MPLWLQVTTGLVTLAVALGSYFLNWRRAPGDRQQLEASAVASYANTARSLLEDMEGLRQRVDAAEARADQHEESERRCARNLGAVQARLASLERMLPLLLAAEVLETLSDSLRAAMDEAVQPMVVTSKLGGGSFLFPNRAFCEAVRRDAADLLELGWRRFLDAGDVGRTEAAEALASYKGVLRFDNRWQLPDGGKAVLRWSAAQYSAKGMTIAFARVLSIDPPTTPPPAGVAPSGGPA